MIQFSVLESSSGNLAKVLKLGPNGLEKFAPMPVSNGILYLLQIANITEFKTCLERIKPTQAFIYGIDRKLRPKVNVVTKGAYSQLSSTTDYITRSKDHLQWPIGPGIMFLDIDDYEGNAYEALKTVLPKIEFIKIISCYSASGNVWIDGTMDPDSRWKRRFYIPVRRIADIDRVCEVLKVRSWLRGLGYYKFSKNYDLLQRWFFDTSVMNYWSIDFAAGSIIKDSIWGNLETKGKEIEFLGTEDIYYDTETHIGNLTNSEKEQYKHTILEDKRKKENERQVNPGFAQYVEQEKKKLGLKSVNAALTIINARYRKMIHASDMLYFDDIGAVRVFKVLQNPESYENKSMRDPIEPEYGPAKAKLYINKITDRPMINSFAHGGRIFEIKYDMASLQRIVETTDRDYISENFVKMLILSDIEPMELNELLENIKGIHNISKGVLKDALKRELDLYKDKVIKDSEIEIADEYNDMFGTCMYGGKFRVFQIRTHNPSFLNAPYIFMDTRDFILRQAHDKLIRTYCAKTVKLDKAKLWLESNYKSFYDEVCFDPLTAGNFEKNGNRILNEFTGFNVVPIKRDTHSDICEIIRDLWDDGDDDLYEFDMSILKTMIQDPGNKASVYRILSGGQGSGKSFLFDHVFSIMVSPYYYMINNPSEITSRFTGTWAKRIMLFIEEAVGVYDRQFHNVLKSLISSRVQSYESKFQDAYLGHNYLWIFGATNDRHVSRMSVDSRREFITYMNEKRLGDVDYWKQKYERIYKLFQIESFMYELTSGKITRNLREIPRTQARQENIRFSVNSKIEFLIEMINQGKFKMIYASGEIQKEIPEVKFGEIIQQYQLKEFYTGFCRAKKFKYEHPEDVPKKILFEEFRALFPFNSLQPSLGRPSWANGNPARGFLLPTRYHLQTHLLEEQYAEENDFVINYGSILD